MKNAGGRVVFAARAARDLDEIVSFIAQTDPAIAARVLTEIEGACSRLVRHPRAGRPRPELAPRLRSFPVVSWVLFYRPMRDGIAVVRVLHKARDAGRVG